MAGVKDTIVIAGNPSPDADNMSIKGINIYKVTFDGELLDWSMYIDDNV